VFDPPNKKEKNGNITLSALERDSSLDLKRKNK